MREIWAKLPFTTRRAFVSESEEMPPGRVSSRRAYNGKIISLDVDTVRFPDGSVGELEMIRHPGATAIVPFLSDPAGLDPQVLLIRQYRYAAEGYLYEIPAGRLNPGEAPRDCALRELKEETGCTAGQVDHLFTMYTTPGFTDEKIHLFMATQLVVGETKHEADEFLELQPMLLSRALQMVEAGEIQDSKTALGLLFAAGFRTGH
jgi:ADP-ribose pyrophosphatase